MRKAIFITARLKSTRLPYKIIKEIMGKPMISHMIDRLKLSKLADFICICTSTNLQDDPLIKVAQENGVKIFRGHEDDVLYRLLCAAKKEKVDLIISCTADNPFVDPEYIDKLIEFHLNNNNDYSKIDGLPFGAFVYAVSFQALKKACDIKKNIDTEVWGGYFTDTGLFKCGIMLVDDKELRRPEIRLTVDYLEDFRLVEEIFGNLYRADRIFTLREIVKFLDANPQIASINTKIMQKPGIPVKIKEGVK